MPKATDQGHNLLGLFGKLAEDGSSLAQAELALAHAEAKEIIKTYASGIVLCGVALAFGLVSLIVLAAAAILALEPFVGSMALASFIIGLAAAVITLAVALLAKSYFTRKHRPVGTIFKWFAGQGLST